MRSFKLTGLLAFVVLPAIAFGQEGREELQHASETECQKWVVSLGIMNPMHVSDYKTASDLVIREPEMNAGLEDQPLSTHYGHSWRIMSRAECATKAVEAMGIKENFISVETNKSGDVFGATENAACAVWSHPLREGIEIYFFVAGKDGKEVERLRNSIRAHVCDGPYNSKVPAKIVTKDAKRRIAAPAIHLGKDSRNMSFDEFKTAGSLSMGRLGLKQSVDVKSFIISGDKSDAAAIAFYLPTKPGTGFLSIVSASYKPGLAENLRNTIRIEIFENRLPPMVDLRPEFKKLGLVPRSQNRAGGSSVCSLFAITALANYELARKDPISPPLSEEFLVWAANEASGLKGDQAMFYEAVHGLNTLGICSQSLMPFESTSDAKRVPTAKAKADAMRRCGRWKVEWIKRWDLKQPLTDQQFEGIQRALSKGHPVAVGMRWQKSDPVNMLDVSVEVFDGHSVVLVGYEQDAKKPGGGVFTFRNSGGAGWGSNGHGTISYAYARAYINDALWLECGSNASETPRERVEAETMQVLSAEKCRTNRQKMDTWGKGMWSRGEQLMCVAERSGQVELGFKVVKAGRYRVRLLATAAPDFGTVRVALDGKSVAADFDLYSGRVCPAGSLELGVLDLTAGSHRLRIVAASKNAASGNYFFGIDALDLLAAD